MGGLGSGFAHTRQELERMVADGLQSSPTTEVLLEESILGWKEYELELMRDTADNTVVVCSIENVDPVGVHTGDSITVAPALTLTDREYQHMRDIGIDIIRRVGVDTGGCNIQFAVDPADGRLIVIEMNRASPARAPSRRRRRASRSRRSPRSSPSATASTRSPTTSRRSRPRASSPRSTTWS
ncbi:Carbamoyl-phosphate synthase large chain [Clavibacter michiganensis subsp. michiganensis]|uniref:Carbamoyl-phosphate synthase large chain n=1 Tax=Clavibacter michiganensis subsp. michiganensis TaxID=33013 RepID=A0A251XIQ2_CLAMM|nr:Carbamoyl-phosphate synthase large chain [Clavibacter michiganensis subsp. michiganensis]OUE02716.1 Carbamoyl-phosphate synthase large chain [Clavibacter michiganensis subsp. michiganensis]